MMYDVRSSRWEHFMADARPVRDEKYAAKTLGRRRMITAVGNAHDGPTRYNIGFAFLDYFCEAAGANWTKDRSLRATTAEFRLTPELQRTLLKKKDEAPRAGRDKESMSSKSVEEQDDVHVVLVKPQVEMADVGKYLGKASRHFEIHPEDILVCHAELGPPLGRAKLRFGGGHVGNRALDALMISWDTPEFPRVCFGIGDVRTITDVMSHVHGPFAEDEESLVRNILRRASKQAVLHVLGSLSHSLAPLANFKWNDGSRFQTENQLGEGHFGEVYAATNVKNGSKVVVKIMKEERNNILAKEIKMLQAIKGGYNVVQIVDTVYLGSLDTKAIVMERVKAVHYRKLFPELTADDVRYYSYELLKALRWAEEAGFLHRDVKPGNVLIDPKKRRLCLIDWGLATRHAPGKEYSTGMGTRPFRAPELCIRHRQYGHGVDIWAFGCWLAAMMFEDYPTVFHGGREESLGVLPSIAEVMGSEAVLAYCDGMGVILDEDGRNDLSGFDPMPWSEFVNEDTADKITPQALDLLTLVLTVDHRQRPNAAAAMEHPWFAEALDLLDTNYVPPSTPAGPSAAAAGGDSDDGGAV